MTDVPAVDRVWLPSGEGEGRGEAPQGVSVERLESSGDLCGAGSFGGTKIPPLDRCADKETGRPSVYRGLRKDLLVGPQTRIVLIQCGVHLLSGGGVRPERKVTVF